MNQKERKKLKRILFTLIRERMDKGSAVAGEADRTILEAAKLLIMMVDQSS